MNPPCKLCGATTLRWASWEMPNKMIQYWLCLECDLAGKEPCIQVRPNPNYLDTHTKEVIP